MQSLMMTMMRMMMIMVALMCFLSSAQADQSLVCQNNFTHSVMCVWNTSALIIRDAVQPETRCFLKITVKKSSSKTKMKTQMLADPEQPHIRRAGVVFRKHLISVAILQQEVWCDGYTNPMVKVEEMVKDGVVKVSPPQTLTINGSTVSWTFSSTKLYDFEVQYRSAGQSWRDDDKQQTADTELHLPEDRLQLQQQYSIRLRVKLKLQRALWSDWSPEHTWTSTVGMQPSTPSAADVQILVVDWSSSQAGTLLTAITLTIIIACTLYFRCSRHKRTNRFSYIPDPSKFFGDLNSSHGGNFKAWLGPVLLRESFINADSELVSPVEVLRLQDACDSLSTHSHTHSGPMDGWDKSSKSSNFSNSTYFLSQSSRGPGDTLEPCSAHSSYGPAGGISGLETQRSAHDGGVPDQQTDLQQLERLRQDTQSPDSGFAGGAEDSIEESELPSPLPISPLSISSLPISPLPISHLSMSSLPISLLPLELQAQKPIIMPPLLGFSCTAALLQPLELLNTCGPVLPSSGDYRPVKSLQNNHCTD
ncbi:interleukin-2 receptor subunit beta [Danio aesculapii]|uniref:interleukin-2 receptor subunit beta n=1 Tax=Danio aesculapii TaxID=1142201 RepID=UPI0024C04F2C|nr:interleukin-2 receptor subunit beta [Danio aesculapii]